MKDVNELTKTTGAPTTQTISLSAITGEGLSDNTNKSQNVSINTINVVSETPNTESATTPKATIKINPNRKKPTRRTIEHPDQVVQVNPEEFIEKAPAPDVKTFKENAISDLEKAVIRKRQEFHDFIERATEEDQINRERVEAGLETVGEEMQYMPDELHVPMTDDERVDSEVYIDSSREDDMDEEFDDFDAENNVEDYNYSEPVVNTNVVVNSTLFDIPTEEVEEDIDVHDEEELVESEDYVEPGESITIEENGEEITYTNAGPEFPEEVEETSTDIDKEIEDTMTFGSVNITTAALQDESTINSTSTSDFEIDESDLEDVDNIKYTDSEESLTEEEIEAIVEESDRHLKAEILQKIIQAGKTLDTSQFVVSNKVINVKDALKGSPQKVERTATWPLTFAGRPFKASALKGPEIALLADADDIESNNSVGITITQARIMFEHDANPYRPATLESWAKTIPFLDIDNIFAAIYVASLKGANYIPHICPKKSCQYSFLADSEPIENMIKFDSDEAKERFEKIKNMQLTADNSVSYESVVSVINDRFAVGLKVPSLYTVLYELGSITPEFIRKYTSAVSIIQYIDYIYLIDQDTMEYKPIGWKTYPGDSTKTFKSKIATYSKILKEFDDAEFSVLTALIGTMVNKAVECKGVNYEIPATKCPKCGSEIKAQAMAPRYLVFMRQRLVELATTPTEK